MPITANKRGYTAGKYAIDMGGVMAGWLFSAEGGHATADVVTEKLGPDHIAKKHISNVKYEDISVSCGTGMSKQFYEWIKSSFDHTYTRKDGAIISADYDHNEVSRLTFQHALISEVGFPALDAASKDAAKMTIKFSPEITRTTYGQGAKISGNTNAVIQKKWLPANFRLVINGLEEACTRVNKIEALTVKQKNVENAVGELRDAEKEPANLEIPNLVITFAESHAKSFYDWHKSFVIDGNAGDGDEKNGSLTFLTPNLKEELFTINFTHLGIFKLTPDKVESHSEGIRRLKAEMYCEEMSFTYHSSAWA